MLIIRQTQFIMKKDENIKFKILLIGPSGVGKTSLLLKYVHNKFSYDYQVTTGIEFFTKEVPINQKTAINLQIWDTMGQEAFKSVVKSHYKGVAAVIFFYSIEKQESFTKLGVWVREVKDNVHQQTLDLQDVRKVGKDEGETYGKEIKAAFFQQISSKTGENVKELFDKLSKHIYKKYQTSKSYKELVKPMITAFNKTESFQLKRQDAVKKKQKEGGCC